MSALAVCVPVDLEPDFPRRATYSKFEKVNCPDCGRQMWMGERTKAVVSEGIAVVTCAVCAIEKHGVRSADRLFPLAGKAVS